MSLIPFLGGRAGITNVFIVLDGAKHFNQLITVLLEFDYALFVEGLGVV